MTEPGDERERLLPRGDTEGDGGDGGIDVDIQLLVERMDPDPKVRLAILAHLLRQLWVERGFVRLADGRIVREGGDAEGEEG